MEFLAGWKERLEKSPRVPPTVPSFNPLPKSPHFYATQLTFVTTTQEAEALVEFVQQRPLSHIGIDTEFCYDRPGFPVKSGRVVNDPRSIHPLLLSLVMAADAAPTLIRSLRVMPPSWYSSILGS